MTLNLQQQAKDQQNQYLRQKVAAFTQQLEQVDQASKTHTYLQRAQLYTQLGEYDKASADYQMAVNVFLQSDENEVALAA